MKNPIKCIFGLVLMLTVIRCDSSTEPDAESIFPLKIGNRWIHETTLFDTLGNVEAIRLDTSIVLKDTLIGGERWYFIGPDSNRGWYATNRDDGHYTLAMSFVSHTPEPRLDLPYPTTVGTLVIHRDTVFGANAIMVDSLYVKALDVPVTTPAGDFAAYHYVRHRRSEINSEVSFWRTDILNTPNIGFVRSTDYVQHYYNHAEWKSGETVLKEYSVQ